jgi:hypothetical protein
MSDIIHPKIDNKPQLQNFCCVCGTTEPKPLPAKDVLCNPTMENLPPIYWLKLDKDNDIIFTVIDSTGKVDDVYVFSHAPIFIIGEKESIVCCVCAKKLIQKRLRSNMIKQQEGFLPGIDDINLDNDFEQGVV